MSDSIKREEVLDLLSRGKITIDEAVKLLDQSQIHDKDVDQDEYVFKAEVDDGEKAVENFMSSDEVTSLKLDEIGSVTLDTEQQVAVDKREKPRWLRIRVANLENGKNKVSVNVPFAMVRFGLGIARVFSPKVDGANIEDLNEVFASAEKGLLVDVEDAESNEHVQIYVD